MISHMVLPSRRNLEDSGRGCGSNFYSNQVSTYQHWPKIIKFEPYPSRFSEAEKEVVEPIEVSSIGYPQVQNDFSNVTSAPTSIRYINSMTPRFSVNEVIQPEKGIRFCDYDSTSDLDCYPYTPFSATGPTITPNVSHFPSGSNDVSIFPTTDSIQTSAAIHHQLSRPQPLPHLDSALYPAKVPLSKPLIVNDLQKTPHSNYPNHVARKGPPEAKKIRVDTGNLALIREPQSLISPLSPLSYSDPLAQISRTITVLIMALWNEEEFKVFDQLPYGLDPMLTRFSDFANFLIRVSGIPLSTVVLSVMYLIRLSKSKSKIPTSSPLLSHKLPKKAKYSPGYIVLVITLILANKYCDDYKVKNSYWSTLTFIQLGVINRAEFDSLKALSFNLYVNETEYSDASFALSLVSHCYEDFDNNLRSNSPPQLFDTSLKRLLAVLDSLKR